MSDTENNDMPQDSSGDATAAVPNVLPAPQSDNTNNDFVAAIHAAAANAQELHAALADVAPVVGISGIGDDMTQYRLDFDTSATPEQITAANNFLSKWPAVRDRQRGIANARADIETWFNAQIAEGFTTSDGYVLGMTNDDVILLTGNYVLGQTLAQLGAPIPDIIDRESIPHPVADLATLTQIMLEYGQYRASLSALYAAKKAELDATIANLPAI